MMHATRVGRRPHASCTAVTAQREKKGQFCRIKKMVPSPDLSNFYRKYINYVMRLRTRYRQVIANRKTRFEVALPTNPLPNTGIRREPSGG